VVIDRGLSVRATERLARLEKSPRRPAVRSGTKISPDLVKVREDLRRALGVKVLLRARGGRGTIEVPFQSLDEFDRILRVVLHRGA
jgi:ParB family chromosome partitioning protein